MHIEPEEPALIHAFPMDGIASAWILDLETGTFGDLRPAMGYGEALRRFGFDGFRPPAVERGPASVRLEISFETDEEIPEDEDAEIDFVTDISLDWSELVESGRQGSSGVQPFVRLPQRDPVRCTTLTFADLEAALGPSTLSELFDPDVDEWLHEWVRDGFFVTATTYAQTLTAVGLSSLSASGEPALRLVT